MIKRLFSDVKSELARVAGTSGMQVTDTRLRELASLAQERLCTLGEWPYQYARLKFNQYGGIVSLPCEYEALVQSTIDYQPVEIQPSWFEFLEYGPGPMDKTQWANVGADAGEAPVYRQPGFTGGKVTVAAVNGADVGNITILGFDTDGTAQSATLALPEAASAIKWSKITSVTKPVTLGDVVLSFENEWGEEFVAGAYRARDINPTFRIYRFPIAEDATKVVHAIARRRLYPITGDTDELFISNIGALRLGVKGIVLEDEGKLAEGATAFGLAARILGDEAKLYKSGQVVVPVRVSRINSLSTRPDIF